MNAEYMKARRLARRQKFVSMLGGKCVSCGEKEGLQFDHIDPKSKSFNYNRAQDGKIEVLEKEMKLCQLLCPACHRKKSKLELDLLGDREPIRHGTLHSYKSGGCRCDCCKDAAKKYRASKNKQK